MYPAIVYSVQATTVISITDITNGLALLLGNGGVQGLLVILVSLMLFAAVVSWFARDPDAAMRCE